MFNTLKKALNKVTGPKQCPNCNDSVTPRERGGDSDLAECPSCGYLAGFTEWLNYSEQNAPLRWENPEVPPSSCRIKKAHSSEGTTWAIPATKKPGFLLFFGLIWTTFTLVFSTLVLFAEKDPESIGFIANIGIFLFLGLFLTVGIVILYFGLNQMLAKHLLLSTHEILVYNKSLLGKQKKTSLKHSDITSIAQKEFYSQNYVPVYGIEIRGKSGKIKFGSALSEEEKAWLVADLQQVILSPSEPSSASPPSRDSSYSNLFDAHLPAPKEDFNLTIPPTKKIASGIFGSLFLCVFGAVFGGLPYYMETKDGGQLDLFLWIFVIMGFAGFCAGLYGIGYTISKIGEEIIIKGTLTTVSVSHKKRHERKQKHTITRDDIIDVRMVPSLKQNGSTHDQHNLIILTKEKAIKITKHRPEAEIQSTFKELEQHLSSKN